MFVGACPFLLEFGVSMMTATRGEITSREDQVWLHLNKVISLEELGLHHEKSLRLAYVIHNKSPCGGICTYLSKPIIDPKTERIFHAYLGIDFGEFPPSKSEIAPRDLQ